jgi:hypothetical protein
MDQIEGMPETVRKKLASLKKDRERPTVISIRNGKKSEDNS